ncbi:MAG: hypothetical protein JRJ59_10940 [Deltaproteobacteria bacterium]|nr:hypothetical protein [Deltaproteobacteria bacterium]
MPKTLLLLVFLVLGPGLSLSTAASKFDQPRDLKADEVMPAEWVKGTHYKLRPKVFLSGDQSQGQTFFNFEMETEFGLFKIESIPLLHIRIHEANVLGRSEELRGENQVLAGIGESLKQMGTNLIDVITDPVGTIKAIPKWLVKMYKRVRGVAGAEKQDRFQHQDSVIEGTLTGGWKRKIAYDLRVDVYTNNPVLRELLQQMANYQAAGGNLLRVASWFVGGPVSLALQAQRFGGWRKQLRDNSAGDLAQYNNERMTDWGLNQKERDSFQDNPILSPVHKTVVLNAVEQLGSVPGRFLLLEPGRKAKTEAQALLLERTAVRILGYHQKQAPLTEIRLVRGLFACQDAKGRIVVPFLSDYLNWSPKLAELFRRVSGKAGKAQKILLHQARLTPLALKNLKDLNFTFLAADQAIPDAAIDLRAVPEPNPDPKRAFPSQPQHASDPGSSRGP